ncbi:MAG: glycosyltransferase [Oenococcus sp.]|uniref:glycosyltransferase n=1 Tax=Oenococcus sp. TaxID=1979414 RepID=UPI0039E79C57
MFYFVSENIFSFNSGTEFSQAKRVQLFNAKGQQAFYVAHDYNPSFHQSAKQLDLPDDQLLNMYDYFQNALSVTRRQIPVRFARTIPKRDYHIDGIDANYSLIKSHGRIIARATIAPLTVGLMGNMIYYDRFGNTAATDYWDWRGFKSSTQYFHPDGQPGPQIFFDPAGRKVMEVIRMNISGQLFPTMYRLFNYHGRDWRFDSENDLFIFFMNEILSQQSESSVIINDRPSMIDAVAHIHGAMAKFQYLHDGHTVDSDNPLRGRLSDVLTPLFTADASAFTGVITATEAQRKILARRFPKMAFYCAPDTFVPQQLLQTRPQSLTGRRLHHLIYFGRLSEEKHPEQAIYALSAIRKKIPDVSLEFRGYASSADFLASLKKIVADKDLSDAVVFADYALGPVLWQSLDQAQMVIQTSTGEGFSMSLIEAMAHGLPAAAYHANFGPDVIIQNGENGFLVKNGSYADLAAAVVKVFQDNALWQHLSAGAYQTAHRYDADSVWRAWQQSGVLPDER